MTDKIMRRISNKDTNFTKLGTLIGGPIIYIVMTIGLIRFSSGIENFWTLGDMIWQVLLTIAFGIIIDYGIKLKNVYIGEYSILIKGIKKSEKLQISDIKKIRSHRLFLLRINRPLVIIFKDKTIFGKKIYFYSTITDKKGKINFLEVLDIKEHLKNLLKENSETGPNT